MGAKGSNDLNMLLSAKVVKLKVQLDVKGSNLTKQVDDISKLLVNKPVKLKVQLTASVADLNKQITTISKTITNAKSFKPMKIAVEMDVKGSATQIKKQLKEVHELVSDFNKKYSTQLKQMQDMKMKAEQSSKGSNIKTDAGVQGFNNIKNYISQLTQAEKQLRGKFSDKQGLFSTTQFKDAQGNLHGFVASLERANGVVERVRYNWNKDKNQFQLIDRQTGTQTEKMVHKSMQSLQDLQRELGKTGKASNSLTREYNELMRAGANQTLTSDAVKGFQTKINNAKEEVRVQKQLNDLKREEAKLLRDIKLATAKTQGKFASETQGLLRQTRGATDAEAYKNIRVELGNLTNKVKEYKASQKEAETVTKQKQQAIRQLTVYLRETHEAEGILSRDNIKAVQQMAQRATTTKQMMAVQKQLNSMYKQQQTNKDLEARQKALIKLKATLQDYGKAVSVSGTAIDALFAQKKNSVGKNLAQIEAEIKKYSAKLARITDASVTQQLNSLKRAQQIPMQNGFNNAKMRKLIDAGDITAIKNYLSQTQKLDIATAKISTNARGISTITTTLASTGKTAKQVTYQIDTLTNKLKFMGQQDVFNRNANLGIFEQMRIALLRVPVWMGAMTAFYGTIRGFKAMATEILTVDKALTELKRVASSSLNIDTIFEGAIDLSKELGNNIHDIMQAINDLARTYGDFNERQLLSVAKTAVLMSNVSDLTAQEATESLVGTMNAFNITAEDSIRIVDSLNEVDNDYAISTKQLATGLQKSASTARTFGVELEENVGHITAIGAVTMESGNIIGNSLKTIYSRITTIDDARGILESVGLNLYKIGDAGEKSIKPVNTILSDLAGKWKGLNDETRQNVAVTVAGRYQLSRFLALMNNWSMSTKATRTALSAQGSAMRENAKLMDSYGSRINKLKTAFTEMSLAIGKAFMNGALLAGIEGLTAVAQATVKIVDAMGALPIILGLVGASIGFITYKSGSLSKTLGSTGAMLSTIRTGFIGASTGANMFSRSLTGSIGALGAFSVLAPNVARGLTAMKIAFRGFISATLIGGAFVVLGIGIEKLIGLFEKQKRMSEKIEKANKALIDSYRNTEGGLDSLIKKQAELQTKVDNRAIKEGTDAYNDYVKVTNQLAEKMPTIVKYIDQSGLAHLRETTAIKEQYDIAKKLSDLKNEETKTNFKDNLAKRLKDINDETKALKDLEKERTEIDKQGKSRKIRDGDGGYTTVNTDNTSALQANAMGQAESQRKTQEHFQKVMILVQGTTMAYLESDKKLKNLTDSGKTVVENMVQVNEELLRYHKEGDDLVANTTEQVEARAETLLKLGQDLGTFMSDTYEGLTKGVEDPMDLKEIKTNVDTLIKALPDTFFKLESLKNVDDLKGKFKGVLSVADQVKAGSGDFDGLTKQLEGFGFIADEAKGYVANLGLEYNNATIRQQAMNQSVQDGHDDMSDWVDIAIKAVDLTQQLFEVGDEDVASMKSNIENLQQLTLAYGDNAKNRASYKQSIEELSLFTGLPDDVILKDLDYYRNVLDLMGKVEMQYDDNTGALIGFNKEGLNDIQVKALETMVHLGKEHGVTYDLVTKKMHRISDDVEMVWNKNGELVSKVKEVNAEIAKTPDANGQKKSAEDAKTAFEELFVVVKNGSGEDVAFTNLLNGSSRVAGSLDEVKARFNEVLNHVNTPTGSLALDGLISKLTFTDGTIDGTKNNILILKQILGNPAHVELLDGMNLTLDETKTKIQKFKEEKLFDESDTTPATAEAKVKGVQKSLDELKLSAQLAKEEKLFNNNDTTPTETKAKIDEVGKSVDAVRKKVTEFKEQRLFELDEKALSGTTATTKTKVDELTEAIKKATSGTQLLNDLNIMVGNATTTTTGLLEKLTNIATGMDGIGNKTGSLSATKDIIEKMAISIVLTQEKIGGLFNGFASSANTLVNPVNNAKASIDNIGLSVDTVKGKVGGLITSLSNVGNITVGGLSEFVHQLGLLSVNFTSATLYANLTASAQNQVVSAFSAVVQITKAYNVAVQATGMGVGATYAQMAKAIAIATQSMINQYVRNATAINVMGGIVDKALKDMVIDFEQATKKATAKVETMGDEMHRAFKSSVNDIVDTASGLPSKIGKAIRENMSDATDSMDALAKDMVRRFKSELGIKSPSRVFAKLGGHVIEGLVKGLDGSDMKSLGSSVFGDFGGGAFDTMEEIKSYMQFGDMQFGGGGADNARNAIMQALKMTGTDASWLQPMMVKAQKESGFNSKAINLWDSNAMKGTPSKGLLQTIDSTFNAYKMKGFDDIYNPVHNAIASINYIKARYGNVWNTPGIKSMSKGGAYKGYAKGGIIDKMELAWHGEEGEEAIIPLIGKRRKRGLELWEEAGNKMGISSDLIDFLKSTVSRGKGGIASSGGGSFGASSGEGGGEGGGGDSGSSGVMVSPSPSIVGGTDVGGNYFTALEMADLTKPNLNEREMTVYGGTITKIEASMQRMTKNTLQYRNALKEVLFWNNKNLAVAQKELAREQQRKASFDLRLKQLADTSKHTEAQRAEYNGLQNEYQNILGNINSLSSTIESVYNTIKEKNAEAFGDYVDELVGKYDKLIVQLATKLDNLDFKLNVLELVEPENVEKQMNLLIDKSEELKKSLQIEQGKKEDLTNRYGGAVKLWGEQSEQAKKVKEELDKAEEAWEDATIAVLQSEKAIKDSRTTVADESISKLKEYYTDMKDMANQAYEEQKKVMEKEHESKMKLYDEEVEKINTVYDAKLKSMDEEKSQSEYQESLDEKNAKKAELVNKISLLSRSNTLEDKKKVAELQKELTEVNKDIADFQTDRQDELFRKQLEEQKQQAIDLANAKKETEQVEFDKKIVDLDKSKENTNKDYDNILNDDKYWAEMKDSFVSGDFEGLQTEMNGMQANLLNMSLGTFDGLTKDFAGFTDSVKQAIADLNKLNVDNMVYGFEDAYDSVEQLANATSVEFTDGNVGSSYLDGSTSKPTKPTSTFSSYEASKVALLDKKENVFKEDNKNLLDTSKIIRSMRDILPNIAKSNVTNKLATASQINTNISYGDINITVEGGDRKKGKDIASEIVKELKKRGK